MQYSVEETYGAEMYLTVEVPTSLSDTLQYDPTWKT